MKRSSYGERDYGFGQAMLTLRTAIGLTQAGLAEFLGVSRKAVGGWEVGGSYPKAEHLKALLTLAVQQGTFPPGREAEEIRAFWQAAHHLVAHLVGGTCLFVVPGDAIDGNTCLHTVAIGGLSLSGGPRMIHQLCARCAFVL